MIDYGNGHFGIQHGDWGIITTWPTPRGELPHQWEHPVLVPTVAQWFNDRSPADGIVELNFFANFFADGAISIHIHDANLAFEFRLCWFADRPIPNGSYVTPCATPDECER